MTVHLATIGALARSLLLKPACYCELYDCSPSNDRVAQTPLTIALQGTYSITLFDDDNTVDCTGGAGTTCAGTKLELGAARLEMASHDTASFIFLSNVDSGSWVLLNSYTYESIQTDDLVDNIGLHDSEDSTMLQVKVNGIDLGDDDTFVLQRTGHTAGAGTGFLITGQAPFAGTNTAGGLITMTAGAGDGSGAGGAVSVVAGAGQIGRAHV